MTSRPQIGVLGPEERARLEQPSDAASAHEASDLTSGKTASALKREARESQHGRNERLKGTFDSLLIWGIRYAAFAFLVACSVWLLNLILPDKLRWLSDSEMSKLQWFVTAGIVTSTALPRMKKALD